MRTLRYCNISFHPLKSITTGEGGAITTNVRKIYDKLITLRSIGIKRSNKHWNYNVTELGLNFRLSDIQCALGISQFKKLKIFIRKRKKISQIYDQEILNEKNVFSIKHENEYNSHFTYIF